MLHTNMVECSSFTLCLVRKKEQKTWGFEPTQSYYYESLKSKVAKRLQLFHEKVRSGLMSYKMHQERYRSPKSIPGMEDKMVVNTEDGNHGAVGSNMQ